MKIHNEIYLNHFRKQKKQQFGKIEINFSPFCKSNIPSIFKTFRKNIHKILKSQKNEKYIELLLEQDNKPTENPYFCILNQLSQKKLKLDENQMEKYTENYEMDFSKKSTQQNEVKQFFNAFLEESQTEVSESFKFYLNDKIGKMVLFMFVVFSKIIWINYLRKYD